MRKIKRLERKKRNLDGRDEDSLGERSDEEGNNGMMQESPSMPQMVMNPYQLQPIPPV